MVTDQHHDEARESGVQVERTRDLGDTVLPVCSMYTVQLFPTFYTFPSMSEYWCWRFVAKIWSVLFFSELIKIPYWTLLRLANLNITATNA
jgi:hypothetical protein